MNEAETRAKLIDPKLKDAGWDVVEGSDIRMEYPINKGEIKAGGIRAGNLKADYLLVYKNRKLATIEAKSDELDVSEGVAQAKEYAQKLKLNTTYSCNGNSIYEINLVTKSDGTQIIESEKEIERFPTPEELWNKTFSTSNDWQNKFNNIPFEPFKGDREPRYYQEIAINNALEAIANNQNRILLTLATGTGKTVIAFHLAWKLFHSRWNIQGDGKRLPRILFLADRNILANQAFNSFGAFDENALVRIRPDEIFKKGSVPTNGSIFFTIFQTFMSGPNDTSYFGEYPKDFFDLVIIDECHRGGAKDESTWREILKYFDSAVHIGLTATPKRKTNADTYAYFNKPVYTYSLKEGINDGYLTPFKLNRITSNFDDYEYDDKDKVVEGDVERRKYSEAEFNRNIEMREREEFRVKQLLNIINPNEKTIVFCATQYHAGMIRDLINQHSVNPPIDYCVRVTAEDGARGDTFLSQFQDNEKTIPTILTTSQKLSTGVDALNIRNIVLLRPVNSMIEFKQIIGRGTRLYEGKNFFTIIDFVNAYNLFNDPEWDGDPGDIIVNPPGPPRPPQPPKPTPPKREKVVIKLGGTRELELTSSSTLIYYEGKPISIEEYTQKLFQTLSLPSIFSNEDELLKLWSNPITRNELLKKLEDNGFHINDLKLLQNLINADDCDLVDVLEVIAYAKKPINRVDRVSNAEQKINDELDDNQKEFINFVLEKYVEGGVEELDINRLSDLITLKYNSIYTGIEKLGDVEDVKNTFIGFQKYLYEESVKR